MWWRSVIFIGAIFGILAFLIPNIAWLISWIVAKICSYRLSYMPFFLAAVSLMVIVWLTVAYGHYFGRFHYEVNNVEYASQDVPKPFDGFRIVHISDLHVDSFDEHPDALQRILDKVSEQNADIILFTGDMTTAEMDNIRIHEKAKAMLQ